MTNELGSTLYDLTIKEILKSCKNQAQKVLANYILEKAPATQIFNVTDVLITSIKKAEESPTSRNDLATWVQERTGMVVNYDKKGTLYVDYSWTPYLDDLFTYAKTNNNMYYVGLIHRLDDQRILMFFGTVNDELKFTIFQSVTIELTAFQIVADYSHMLDSVRDYIELNHVTDERQRDYLLSAMHICFTGYFVLLLKMFNDLTDKDTRPCRCYVDECDDNKTYYYRSPLDKKVTKIGNKPIILILDDGKDVEQRAHTYKRRNGTIHYAFSWVVRGHYRRLHNPKSMGMDRNGERCVPGMTWIETYMKGDENLPLLKRERVVKDMRTV